MGKKKLKRQVEYANQNAAWKQELFDGVEGELEAVKWELASTINRVIELGEENDRLHDENELLRSTIVDQAVSMFDIARNATTNSVSLYDSAEWPS